MALCYGKTNEVSYKKSEVKKSELSEDIKSQNWKMIINSAKDLKVYKAAYELAMEIFEISKQWPVEERYSLIDQIRRASRSVCANMREAWLPARRL